jgi:hypothetical protein
MLSRPFVDEGLGNSSYLIAPAVKEDVDSWYRFMSLG